MLIYYFQTFITTFDNLYLGYTLLECIFSILQAIQLAINPKILIYVLHSAN
jgi:hypothetical protein